MPCFSLHFACPPNQVVFGKDEILLYILYISDIGHVRFDITVFKPIYRLILFNGYGLITTV